ncbi:MAG: SoxR reducing system RseC family protein [Eubacteriales bacterium]|nr:SoxR reducing system RseC family protein [Eubacteriales bacterium]
MTEKGKVTEVIGDCAIVEVKRMSACESCHKNSEECIVCTLGGGRRKTSVKVENVCRAKVGDTVMLEADSKTVLLYAAAVFLFPIAMAFIAWLLAERLFSVTGSLSFLFAIGGFAVAFIIIYFTIGRYAQKKSGIYMSKIIAHSDDSDDF